MHLLCLPATLTLRRYFIALGLKDVEFEKYVFLLL